MPDSRSGVWSNCGSYELVPVGSRKKTEIEGDVVDLSLLRRDLRMALGIQPDPEHAARRRLLQWAGVGKDERDA